ncbi:hypothetical protein, partial [Cupriavidus pauculus]|uniref:hypothetical protein n=1 Tax=Cupriavidus pauculus TaxID=82633 RepID=UPI001EE1EB18
DQIFGNGRQLTIGGLARLGSTWHDMLLGDMLCPKHKISDGPGDTDRPLDLNCHNVNKNDPKNHVAMWN